MVSCQYCSNQAVYLRKISNEYVCKTHFCETIEKKIRKTIRKYNMFSPQEKVVVGVSGGKDSLVLLYNVLLLQKRYPKSPQVEAILIDEGIEGYRAESIKIAIQKCEEWGVPLHIVPFLAIFGDTLDNVIPKLNEMKINACTVCGTVRRRLLNMKARELEADKLAIGHNLDDQAETFLQNIVRNDIERIFQHPPNGNIEDPSRFFVPRIKPLIMIPEAEITRYCYYKEIPIQESPCPYTEGFFILRKEIQEFINRLEVQSAEIKFNLITMNEKILEFADADTFSKKIGLNSKKILEKKCKICTQPCGNQRDLCYFCELKNKIGLKN